MGTLFLLAATLALVLGFARVLNAPKPVSRMILLMALAGLLLSQVVLPPGHPLRQSLSGPINVMLALGLAAIPILAYAMLVRALRRRAVPVDQPSADMPFVLVADDAGLVADIENLLARGDGVASSAFSILQRTKGGDIAAAARCRVLGSLAEIGPVWLAPELRFSTTHEALLAATGAEARTRLAKTTIVLTDEADTKAFYQTLGFIEYGHLDLPGGLRRHALKKDLT